MKKKSNSFVIKKTLIVAMAILGIILYQACTGNMDSESAEMPEGAADPLVEGTAEFVTSTITVSPTVPLDVTDPSSLSDAADFAWEEFIALTWPAEAQGPTNYPRGKAQASGKYGDKGPTGQVVWETYRHRVEAFPGKGNPNGYDTTSTDYGWASKPEYIYDKPIPPFNPSDPDRTHPPFNNLDEVTQISLNAMYAGASGHHTGGNNSVVESQRILFQAKVNEVYYKYIAKNKYFESATPRVQNIKTNSAGYAETGDATKYPGPYTNLPASNPQANTQGSIEIKAAWRELNPNTDDISSYYTAPVRYYLGDEKTMKIGGYVDSDSPSVKETWGLIALHIIHKTPNAPAFVFATFSHYNNILDAKGNSVEDKEGTTYPKYLAQEPYTPALQIDPAPTYKQGEQSVFTKSGTVNTNSPQLYFLNSAGKPAITTGSASGADYTDPVVVNRRIYPIPPTIVGANKAAHDAIKTANPNAVWLNYKLVNVQAQPLDYVQDSVEIFKDGGLAPTYFLANEVVETNPSLQNFSGSLNALDGNIFNYGYNSNFQLSYVHNVFVNNNGTVEKYNMGGCMGCHGAQGQKQGGDFSVLLANGRIAEPDIIQLDVSQKAHVDELTKKYTAKSN